MRYFSEDDDDNKITKAQILKKEADRKAVREYEQNLVKNSRTFEQGTTGDDNVGLINQQEIELNALWRRVKDFLSD